MDMHQYMNACRKVTMYIYLKITHMRTCMHHRTCDMDVHMCIAMCTYMHNKHSGQTDILTNANQKTDTKHTDRQTYLPMPTKIRIEIQTAGRIHGNKAMSFAGSSSPGLDG